ncbi:hypothetical protein GE107_24875 [Cohnella sp. CFH 77786]|uniref:S-layer homology domain-containing protein n=1 Tax=Cohnella sp. CFH 77786 TaxID=2662265 RepID=UPI001C61114C|nr:S-layer homology domain-containing protein [Cohnella sp. CFH 77786]MBW5449263.1 hypothetical protein [Cohnella sp. CFH 77786]
MNKNLSLPIMALLMACAIAFVPGKAHAATTQTYTAAADVFQISNSPDMDNTYDNDTQGLLYVGMTYQPPNYVNVKNRSAIMFDLGTKAGQVASATLELYASSLVEQQAGQSAYIDVWGAAPDTITNADGSVFPSIGSATAGRYWPPTDFGHDVKIAVDVTDIVKAFTSDSDRKVTLVLTGNEADSQSGSFYIYSSEASQYVPKLVVTYNEPPTGSFSFNEVKYTNSTTVNVSVSASDPEGDSIAGMRFTEDPNNWPSTWQSYATSASLNLSSGDKLKTVYAQFMDAAGNVSKGTISASITLDTTAPTVTGVTYNQQYNSDVTISFNEGTATLDGSPIASGTTYGSEGTHTLIVTDKAGNVTTIPFTIDKTPPTVTGVTYNQIYNRDVVISFNDGTARLDGSPIASGTTYGSEGAHTLIVTDEAGNVTTIPFTIDKTAPTGTVLIDGGSSFTKHPAVTLKLTDHDGSGTGVQEMQFSNDNRTWSDWEAATGEKSWTATTGDGTKTVYVRLRDAAGNVNSAEISDSIVLDTTAPTGTFTINHGASSATSPVVALAISADDGAGSGAVEMRISNNETDWTDWEGLTATKTWTLTNGYGPKQVFVQFRDALGNVSSAVHASILYKSQPSGGDNSGNNNRDNGGNTDSNNSGNNGTSSGDNRGGQNGTTTIVIGEPFARTVEETVNDRKSTTVIVDGPQLLKELESVSNRPIVSIPINGNPDIAAGIFTGEAVKAMTTKNALLELITGNSSYTLPAEQIGIDALSGKFGADTALQDIELHISVTNIPDSEVRFAAARGDHIQLVAPAVEFTVKAVHDGQEIEVQKFNAFVERTIAIPDGVDPNKVTTGVVVGSDGTLHHVPTKVAQVNGKYVAVINSLTNSVYALIYNHKTLEDISGHWAKAAIEDMASRLIVSGTDDGRFLPDKEITRAEFTAIVVRALGLRSADAGPAFTDVHQDDWFASAVHVGVAYGLVSGYDDGTFRPNKQITREEAMVIIARAMRVAQMKTELAEQDQDKLLAAFGDNGQFHSWSREAAALTIRSGIVTGNQNQARPLQNITRAETAVIIRRFLQQAGLI